MPSKRPSPLKPGAYGKPQRWHEILTAGAEARAAKREQQRKQTDEATQNSILTSAAASIASLFR